MRCEHDNGCVVAASHPIESARLLADELLLPQAAEVDAADAVPVSHLDALAAAGLYGLVGPRSASGLGADLATLCAVVETLAGGDLATTFVWLQHQSLVLTLSADGIPANLANAWLGPLCRGERRAGIAGGGLLPGPPNLRAEPIDDGWLLEGESPWVSGWGLIDVVHVAARTADDGIVDLIVDAVDSDRLVAARQHLIAVDASRTVRLAFEELFVPATRFICKRPYDPVAALSGPALRVNGSLALGVAARCSAMLGPSSLDADLAECRCRLDEAEPTAIGAARAAASTLALHASAALIVSAGSGAIVARHHAERLAREALFLLVFGSRPAIRTALLERLLPN